MAELRIISWNVNGIRAAVKKGFHEWFAQESPEILCVQETKARPEQLDDKLVKPVGYQTYWNFPERKGYSGVAAMVKEEPLKVLYDTDITGFDSENRIIGLKYPQFTLFNVYFPNGKRNEERLDYKLCFYDFFLEYIDSLKEQGENIIVCGDFNTAHCEIDLARPKQNETVSGFLPVEREWLDKLVAHGYNDAFRQLYPDRVQYSWWDMKTRARERDIGWRIDYFFVSDGLLPALKEVFILPDVFGSDHCPVGIKLELK